MERSSFFNAEIVSGNYDRTYLAEDFARYFASFIGNGVYASPAGQLQVTASGADMQITVKAGKAWTNGYFYENTADMAVTLENADGVMNRIDMVVVRLDLVNREMTVKVKKGAFATNPEAQAITRDADVYELQLASIYVAAGTVKITQAEITDTRMDSAKCGVVSGVVDQIDMTNLFAQYNAAFDQWFATVRGILGEDEAANLLNLINTQTAALEAHEARADNPHGVTASQTGAAPASHTHAPGDLTAAVPVSKGGTGAATAADARAALGVAYGTAAGTVCQGNDSRLSNARTPTAHNQAASTITAGTLPAGVVATNSTDYGTSRLRNIRASTTDLTAGTSALSNGELYLVYE